MTLGVNFGSIILVTRHQKQVYTSNSFSLSLFFLSSFLSFFPPLFLFVLQNGGFCGYFKSPNRKWILWLGSFWISFIWILTGSKTDNEFNAKEDHQYKIYVKRICNRKMCIINWLFQQRSVILITKNKKKWSAIEWLCYKAPDSIVYFLSFSFKVIFSFTFLRLVLVYK